MLLSHYRCYVNSLALLITLKAFERQGEKEWPNETEAGPNGKMANKIALNKK